MTITETGTRKTVCRGCGKTLGEVTVPGPSFTRVVGYCTKECQTTHEMDQAVRQAAVVLAFGEAIAEAAGSPPPAPPVGAPDTSAHGTRDGRLGESQPLPTVDPNDGFIQDLVIQDIEARRRIGVERYGSALQAHNGRNALLDAYEEVLDLAMYLKQRLVEEGNPQVRDSDRFKCCNQKATVCGCGGIDCPGVPGI